jgi:O-antigen/teichoic acid export membrane protein
MFTVIKQQREGMTLSFVNLAALAALLLALVPPYGAWGAALAVTITQTVAWLGAVAWLDLRHLRALRTAAPGFSPRDS